MTLRKKYLILAAVFALAMIPLSIFFSRSALRLSVPSGFYDTEFTLEILSDRHYDIYYTLDGSSPTMKATAYTGPIRITDASQSPNVYAEITDVSVLPYADLVKKYSTERAPEHYPVPDYLLDKCTVLRAAAYDDGTLVKELTASYFVGFDGKSGYDGLKIVSLVTDPANLFDPETGVYVAGNSFQAYKDLLGTGQSNWEKNWYFWEGNFRLRGRESEREAYIQIFDTDGTSLLSSPCGFRIQGNGSRGYLPKNLSIYARTEYGGSETFDLPPELFGEGIQPHKFVLFGGGDDREFKLNDYLVQNLTRELRFGTMILQPCALFLDGEYWGTYFIAENYNAKHLADHYGIQEQNVIFVKENALADGRDSDMDLYSDMVEFFLYNDMSLAENYQRAQEIIDIDSALDYFATQIYIARCADWPDSNVALWRSRSVTNRGYQDGRWRWLLYDSNTLAMMPYLTEHDTLAHAKSLDPIFASLLNNASFREAFVQRLYYVADEVFSQERCSTVVEQYLDTLLDPLCASNRRFTGEEKRAQIQQRAADVLDFFAQRREYLDTMITENFGEGYGN